MNYFIGSAQKFDPGGTLFMLFIFILILVLRFIKYKIKTKTTKIKELSFFTSYNIPSLLSAPFINEVERLKLIEKVAEGSMTLSKNPYLNHTSQMVYLSCGHGMPIVFDTGASVSITPLREDFIGNLKPSTCESLNSLHGTVKVVGEGMVEWTVFDVNNVVKTIRTRALYIPDGNICLFSPQTYFQENMKGHAKIGINDMSLTLSDDVILRFPYAGGCNLPLMLTRNEPQPMVGLSHLDITTISNSAVAFLNVADEVNQNLTASQKELLLWHWRLGHAHFQ
jgi:hypothetical protein